MARHLIFATITFLLAVAIYRLLPTFPKELENFSFSEKPLHALSNAIYKLGLMAEVYGFTDDSAISIRKIIHKATGEVNTVTASTSEIAVESRKIADVPVVIFRPKSASQTQLSAVMIYFHGGAFVFGNPATHFLWTKRLALDNLVTVISVDYALAPERPFPGPIEDCVKVTKAVFDQADELKIDPSRIMVAGDSAGGNLAGVVAIELALSEKYQLKGQILLSPIVQAVDISSLPSYRAYHPLIPFPTGWIVAKYAGLPYSYELDDAIHSGHLLTAQDKINYAGFVNISGLSEDVKALIRPEQLSGDFQESGRNTAEPPSASVKELLAKMRSLILDERAWPLLTKDEGKLRKMCPALIIVTECDPLRDEALLYYDRLRSVGAEVKLSFLPGVTHVRPMAAVTAERPISSKVMQKCMTDIGQFVKTQLMFGSL